MFLPSKYDKGLFYVYHRHYSISYGQASPGFRSICHGRNSPIRIMQQHGLRNTFSAVDGWREFPFGKVCDKITRNAILTAP
jgi:hypothetical protein